VCHIVYKVINGLVCVELFIIVINRLSLVCVGIGLCTRSTGYDARKCFAFCLKASLLYRRSFI
jgi:hypothetical protein